MKTKNKTLCRLLAGSAIAALLGASSQAMAATFSDGNFASPWGGPLFTTYSGGSLVGPWLVIGNSVDLSGGIFQAPSPGGGSVDLDGNYRGGITQSFDLGPGSYVLSFSLSGNPEGDLGVKKVAVVVGDSDQIFTYDTATKTGAPYNSDVDMRWASEVLPFATSGGPTTLAFVSLSGANYGPVIGNVSILPTPLPAALPMFGAAIAGLGGLAAWLSSRTNAARPD